LLLPQAAPARPIVSLVENKKPVNFGDDAKFTGFCDGGADRDRTCDPHNAIVVLYQLSYDPIQSGENLRTRRLFVKQFVQGIENA
jgi:hypothetical protein